jgi:hypothetical protein
MVTASWITVASWRRSFKLPSADRCGTAPVIPSVESSLASCCELATHPRLSPTRGKFRRQIELCLSSTMFFLSFAYHRLQQSKQSHLQSCSAPIGYEAHSSTSGEGGHHGGAMDLPPYRPPVPVGSSRPPDLKQSPLPSSSLGEGGGEARQRGGHGGSKAWMRGKCWRRRRHDRAAFLRWSSLLPWWSERGAGQR